MATDIGTGAMVTFGTSGYSAEILSIDFAFERDSINVSHMLSTTAHETIPADLFSSTFDLETNFLMGAKPPINGANETITIVIPNGAGTNSWVTAGHLTSFNATVPLEDKSTASLSVTCNGDWTVT